MERVVSYLNISRFLCLIEELRNPELRGRPFAIGPLYSDQGKIWQASEAAAYHGIKKGMKTALAKRECRELKVLAPNPDLYCQVHKTIEKTVKKLTPLYEIEKQGHLYLDLTGMKTLHGAPQDFALNLQKTIHKELSLPSSIGVSNNKLVSRIAGKTVAKQREIQMVHENEKTHFLSPLSLDLLPIMKKMKKRGLGNIFEELNLATISDLTDLSPLHLQIAFGNEAEKIYQMARGRDFSPVQLPEQKEVVFKDRHLENEHNNREKITKTIFDLIQEACFELKQKRQQCSLFCLGVRFSDFKFSETSYEFQKPVQENFHFNHLVPTLLNKILMRRTSIRYLYLEMQELSKEVIQLSLFNELNKKMKLQHTLDDINKRFSSFVIKPGHLSS